MTEKQPLDLAFEAALRGDHDKSEQILRTCEQNDARVIFNLGWHELRHGNLSKGLSMLDAGRFINVYGSPPIEGEIWRDQDLNGKTLMLRCEGGMGDEMLQVRWVKEFEAMGANVIVSCHTTLKEFFASNGMTCINSDCEHVMHYDYWLPAKSVAPLLGYEHDTLSGKPYLKAKGKRDLYAKSGTLKVGVKWAGNPQFEHQQFRTFDPDYLISLHERPELTLYSLQRDENMIDGLPFADLRDQMKTWSDTAEIVSGLDLVISSCTSIIHLAGALGVEAWVLAPVMPYYTWAKPEPKTPWYDSVRVFRQKTFGKWDEPFAEMRKELDKRCKALKAA